MSDEDLSQAFAEQTEEILPPKPNGGTQPEGEFDEVNLEAVKAKHRGLTGELDRLADLKRQVLASQIEQVVFEAELRDVAEKYKKQGMTPARARDAVEHRLRPPMSDEEARKRLAEGAGSQRDEVREIGVAGKLWHDADREAYATIRREQHRETWQVRSRDYRLHLIAEYRERYGRAPAKQALAEGIDAIEAAAVLDGAEHEPRVRVAGSLGGDKVYLDLCDDSWNVVEIDAAGWRVIADPPVRFVRPRGLRPLPEPKPSRDGISKLAQLVNLRGDAFVLYVSWIVGCLAPAGPYAVLVLSGEQGTAKSTAIKIACELVDPGKVKISGPPRSEPDLAIAASKRHIVAYDNLSQIDGWLADALSRLATGAGLQKRMLYTDDEQSLIAVCRPVAVNGIPDLAERADFADRVLALVLEPIPKNKRRSEKKIWAAFAQSAPEILGALLDGVSRAVRDGPRQAAEMTETPRMADFAEWAAAAAPAFGWSAADVLRVYGANREEAVDRVLEADPVAEAVIEFAEQAYSWKPAERDGVIDPTARIWRGTATDLLAELARLVPEDTRRERRWPKDATRLSGCLRRAAPPLRTKRIEVGFSLPEREELPGGGKGKHRRMIMITAPGPGHAD
jgi:hypothetical protein